MRQLASRVIAVGVVLPAACGLGIGPAYAGPAIGQFEIKTLSAEPGELEFQSQNAYSSGNPRRRLLQEGGELEGDDNSITRQRHALEIEVGITRFLKTRVGIEYERERFDDFGAPDEAGAFGAIELDEYAAEAIVVFVPRSGDGWGLGLVVEYEHPAQSGGARTLNSGLIFEYAHGGWVASFNPTITQFIGGERNASGVQDEKIDFGYTARFLYQWSDDLEFALEAYGTVERIGGHGGRSDASALFGDFDQHRIGPVGYWTLDTGTAAETTIGLGTLFGLNGETPDMTFKASLEVTF